MGWSVMVICVAIFLCGTALYSVSQQERFVKEFTGSLQDLLEEADIVKQDLEAAMDNAVIVSEQMVTSLDERISYLESVPQEPLSSGMPRQNPPPEVVESSLPFNQEELRQAHPYLVVPRLYRCGYDLEEIARILGRGQGEIELILNLYKKKQACV